MKKLSVLALYMLAMAVVYGSFLDNPFIMDDEIHIVENRHIHNLSKWPSYFTSSSMDSGGAEKMQGIYYKPLLMTHFAVIYNFFGADPVAYRLPNYVLHSANSYLIFLIATGFLPFVWAAVLGGLFLLHPANAEVVLYICDMQDILYLFFGLLSLLVAIHARTKAVLFAGLSACFWLGLFSKETAALFLVISNFYLFLFRRSFLATGAIAAGWVTVGYAVLRWSIDLVSTKSHHLLFHQVGYLERAQTFPLIWAHYFELLFWPERLSLTTDYVVRELSFSVFWGPLLFFAGVLFLIGVGFFYFKRKSHSEKKWFWFFCFVLLCWFGLHSHILVPLDGIYTDRWLYLAVWAFLAIVVLIVSRLPQQRTFLFLAAVVICAYGARDFIRGQDWQNPLRLYSRELELHPHDAVMSNNVGVSLFRQGNWQESKRYFIRSTELNPSWNVAYNNWGAIEEKEGEFEKALELYRTSFELSGYSLAVENYAKLLCRLDRLPACYQHVKRFLEVYPHNSLLNDLHEHLQRILKIP